MWNKQGSESSVSSEEQIDKDCGGGYLTESSGDERYNAFVHELEMGMDIAEESDASLMFVDIDASLSGLSGVSFERSNSITASVESFDKNWEASEPPMYNRRQSLRRRLIAVLTVLFILTAWKVTNSFKTQQQNLPLDVQSQPMDTTPLHLPQARPQIVPLELGPTVVHKVGESVPSQLGPTVVQKVDESGSKSHPAIGSIESPSSEVDLSTVEYKSANIRTRNAASKPEFNP